MSVPKALTTDAHANPVDSLVSSSSLSSLCDLEMLVRAVNNDIAFLEMGLQLVLNVVYGFCVGQGHDEDTRPVFEAGHERS